MKNNIYQIKGIPDGVVAMVSIDPEELKNIKTFSQLLSYAKKYPNMVQLVGISDDEEINNEEG